MMLSSDDSIITRMPGTCPEGWNCAVSGHPAMALEPNPTSGTMRLLWDHCVRLKAEAFP